MSILRINPGLVAVMAIGWVAAAHSASAQAAPSGPETISTKVTYRDLDLGNVAGAKVILVRIRHAAKTVCGTLPDDMLDGGRQYRACVDRVTDKSVRTLDAPLVSAMNGGPVTAVSVALAARR